MPTVRGVFTYGAPRVGDATFAHEYHRLDLTRLTTTWVDDGDPVPQLPPHAFGYRHVAPWGLELATRGYRRVKLDATQRVAKEADWISGLPITRPLFWLARRIDDALQGAKEHSIKDSYLPQLEALER